MVLLHGSLATAGSFDCATPGTPTQSNPLVLGNGSAGSVTRAQLQQALDTADEVRLNIGSSTLVLDQTLQLTRAVSFHGGGATLSGGSARRVMEITNPGLLNDFTITLIDMRLINGDSRSLAGDDFARSGAAILNDHGSEPWRAVRLHAFDLEMVGNRAVENAQDGGGGGIYLLGHREFICVRCLFDDNSGSNGGGYYGLGTQTMRFYDSVFIDNLATGDGGNPGGGGNGGAMAIDGATRELSLCRTNLIANRNNAFGAGIFTTVYDQTSVTRIWQSSIDSNVQQGTDQHTGGAYIQGGPVSIRNSTFRNNQARGYGGLALFDHGAVAVGGEIVNSTFEGNLARTTLGGAMNLDGSNPLLLQNLTVANNRADCAVCFAGGIVNPANAPITLRNTIFLNNTGGNAFNPWAMLNPVANGSNNLQWPQYRQGTQEEQPVSPGSSFADALLAPIADNGGLTQTMALLNGSPAIDTGTPTGAPTTDQRGLPRFGVVDIGAFEVQGGGDGIFADGYEG